jgi:hypothetical protein
MLLLFSVAELYTLKLNRLARSSEILLGFPRSRSRISPGSFFSLTAKYVNGFDVISLKSASGMGSKGSGKLLPPLPRLSLDGIDTSGEPMTPKLFQRPKRRYFAEFLAFATLGLHIK